MNMHVLGVVALSTLALLTTPGTAQTGACCVPNGDPICTIETPADCANLGGAYLGDGVPCEQQAPTVRFATGAGELVLDLRAVTTCPAPGPECVDGPYHVDPWRTTGDQSRVDFGAPEACPLPADFFGPGSDPFDGTIGLTGNPLGVVTLPGFPDPLDFGAADTLVRREFDPFDRCALPPQGPEFVPIVIERLSLVGIEPIVVTFNGGQDPEEWDVEVRVDGSADQPGGQMEAIRTHCNGGTFTADLHVCPRFVFVNLKNPEQVQEYRICDDCNPSGFALQTQAPAPWVFDPGVNLELANPVCSDFHAGLEQTDPTAECDCNENGVRDTCDIEEGTSEDQNGTGVPDECEPIINEVDADTPGTDDMEFIELYDGGVGNTPLDGLVVVLYNGSDDASYEAYDLDELATDANGYFVLGNALVPGVDLIIPNSSIQNGPDAVALHVGDADDFPNDTPVTTVNLIDAIVYDTNDGDDSGLLVLLNAGQPQVNEGGGGNSSRDSNQRCPNGAGGPRNTDTYLQALPTPGAENLCDAEPTGACCDRKTFICEDGVLEADCQGETQEWTEGVACADLDPPCEEEQATGACCDDGSGTCLDEVTEEDCLALGRRYGGDDSTCETLDPPCKGIEPGNLLISEIVDATLTGGQPKFVEITNCDEVEIDLSDYSIGNYNNGGTNLGGGASTRLSGVLSPGESYVFAYERITNDDCDPDVTCFEFVYGNAADQYTGPFINGNDVVALFAGLATGDGSDATLVDVYGVIGVDGVGEVWEYTDGYSYRKPKNVPTDTFDPAEWVFGGVNSLETGDDETEIILIRAETNPFVHFCECAGDVDGDNDVDFDDLLLLLSAWGPVGDCPPTIPEDLDEDCEVDFDDLTILLSTWPGCNR